MSRTKRSWSLFKRAMQVVLQNKKLLLFPITVSFLTLLIAAFFLVPLGLHGTGHAYTDAAHWETVVNRWVSLNRETGQVTRINPMSYVVLACMYMVSVFLATFFNVAFYGQILNALNGRPVSITRGMQFACTWVV